MALVVVVALPSCLGDFKTEQQLKAELAAQAAADGTLADATDGAMADADAAKVDVVDVAVLDLGSDSTADILEAVDADSAIDAGSDATSTDTGPACGDKCPCLTDSDCPGGACLDTNAGPACAWPCANDNSCAADARCVKVPSSSGGPGATVQVCAKKFAELCDPCKASVSCEEPGSNGGACVDLGDQGSYCGTGCTSKADCPSDYDCLKVKTVEGASSQQCVKSPDIDHPLQPGQCKCSWFASVKQLSTTCGLTVNDASGKLIGTCKGQRSCSPTGLLSACDAPVAATESCDGADNDCDGQVDDVNCDDGDPCTADGCGTNKACLHSFTAGAACSDGDLCTTADTCTDNSCKGTATVCDGTPCWPGSCNAKTGACVNTAIADGTPCSDGSACTQGDLCKSKNCNSGAAVNCDDGNPCTDDSCDSSAGCTHAANTSPCSDGVACTNGDTCSQTKCVGTVNSAACDDNNVCTKDICQLAIGCTHTDAIANCDDGNACTTGDSCKAGTCVGGANQCSCQKDADCPDDKNLCNGTVFCDKSALPYTCKVDAASVITCPAATDPCKVVQCNSKTGACDSSNAADATSCDDQNVCTLGTSCKAGICTSSASQNCDDSNACTDDSCDAKAGCQHKANAAVCSDGNACTSGDTCTGGTCVAGVAVLCASSNICVSSTCNPSSGQCVTANLVGTPCSDGDPCTTSDSCQSGNCAGVKMNCDDGNACTTDSCAAGGCLHTTVSCDDGNPCTVDSCFGLGGCQHTPKTCGSDLCSGSVCDPNTGNCVVNSLISCPAGQYCSSSTGKCGHPMVQPVNSTTGGDAHACARVTSYFGGGVVCWGDNTLYQLSNGTKGGVNGNLVSVASEVPTESVDAGSGNTCACSTAANVCQCWGNNKVGQCGIPNNSAVITSPQDLVATSTGGVDVILMAASAGGSHGCAVSKQNQVYCFGDNTYAQLGQGLAPIAVPASATPLSVPFANAALWLSAGLNHTCVINKIGDQKVFCWGDNQFGQVTPGQQVPSLIGTPTQVTGFGGGGAAFALSAGANHNCLIINPPNTDQANVFCWGRNNSGQVGGGGKIAGTTKINLPAGSYPISVAAGGNHTCVLTAGNNIYCWGSNTSGQLGNGGSGDSAAPVSVLLPKSVYNWNWKHISSGAAHSCATREDGTVWCWGSNVGGVLGNTAIAINASSNVPVQVLGTNPQ